MNKIVKIKTYWQLLVTTFCITFSLLGCSSGDEKNKQEIGLLEQDLSYLQSLRKPAYFIKKTNAKKITKTGGLPLVSSDFKWPQWKNKPLAFLLQVDLKALSKLPDGNISLLPEEGLLSFFYDSNQSTWGFDPKDKGSWQVIYTKNTDLLKMAVSPKNNSPFKESFMFLEEIAVYPDLEDERIRKLNLNNTEYDEYIELKESVFDNQPAHYLFGYPSTIQGNDMDLESQLASNGIYLGSGNGYKSEKAKTLITGRSEWQLLLQLDTDEINTNMMWGDAGRLFFWIRTKDLQLQKFENVWMILQSY